MKSDYDAVAVQEAVDTMREAVTQVGDPEEALASLLADAWEDGRRAESRYRRGSYREGNPYCKPTEGQT